MRNLYKKATRKPRTSEQLGEAEKAIRYMKKTAKFQEDHPKIFKALLGIAGIGVLVYLGNQRDN
ncbi:MAG TPA: hypothetical protein VF598_05265 [Hymenobacter sp.]|jgi:hypothetical protein